MEHIEQNAAKYDSNNDNLKERFFDVSNKCNDLIKLNNDSWKKYIDGGYCHEQSFRFGFQEGVEYTEKQILNRVKTYLENEVYTSFNMFGNAEVKTKNSVDKYGFINNLIKAIED